MGCCLGVHLRNIRPSDPPEDGRQRHFSTPTLNSLTRGLYKRFAQSSANVPTVMVTQPTPMASMSKAQFQHLDCINTSTGIPSSLPHCNLGLFILDTLRQLPVTQRIFTVHEERTLTIGELINQAKTTYFVVQALELNPGDMVICLLSNCSQFPAFMIACCLLQLPMILLSHRSHLENKAVLRQLDRLNVKVMFCTKDMSRKAERLRVHLKSIQRVVVLDCEIPSNDAHTSLSRLQSTYLPSTCDVDDVSLNVSTNGDWSRLPAFCLFSMGRTCTPRLIKHSHKCMLAAATAVIRSPSHFTEEGVILGLLPLYHVFGISIQLIPCLLTATHLVFLSHSDPSNFLNSIQTHQVRNCILAPPALEFLSSNNSVDNVDISSLRKVICCTATPNENILHNLYRRFSDIQVSIGYGMCETSGLTHLAPGTRLMTRSSGKVLTNVQAKIEDVNRGRAQPYEKQGEICIRCPSMALPETQQSSTDITYVDANKWIHTGDLGYFDRNENFYVTSTIKCRLRQQDKGTRLYVNASASDNESVGSDSVFLE